MRAAHSAENDYRLLLAYWKEIDYDYQSVDNLSPKAYPTVPCVCL